MKTFKLIYKPTGELVLDAAARYRGIQRRFKRVRQLVHHDAHSIDEVLKKRGVLPR